MNPYSQLARESIAFYLENGKMMPLPDGLPADFYNQKAGAFVSLHKRGLTRNGTLTDAEELRGCIGTVEATKPNLGQEIISNAVAAATRDPRFLPLEKNELENHHISVDVLSEPEPIPDLENHDPKKYGLIAVLRGHSGLLLPDLPSVDTAEDQLSIVLQKAGIAPDEEYKLYRFTVERHE